MKKISVFRQLALLAVSSLLAGAVVLTASADEDGQQSVEEPVVATSIATPQVPKYPTTARYLGRLFHLAV